MLNQRQLEMIIELFEHPNNYMTVAYFAEKQQVTVRTIQNDIKRMKDELEKTNCIDFQSLSRKGCRIVIKESEEFRILKDYYYHQFSSCSTNYQNERINEILLLLLNQYRAISLYNIENTIFVSHSTLLNDLKQIEIILDKFHLELMHSSNKVIIDGSEVNKRLCIMEQNLITNTLNIFSGEDKKNDVMEKIKNVLIEVFVSFQHSITEVALNNLILHIYVALQRMQKWFFISPSDLEFTEQLDLEKKISSKIFQKISEIFLIRIPDTEIDYFALYIKGQGNLNESDVISKETDDLVLGALMEIRDVCGIDLTDNIKLQIAMSLHIAPLIVRIKYDMQLKNNLVDYIKQNFPQGFDIATYFATYLQKILQKHVIEDEIAFIAIYLYTGLLEHQKAGGTKRVLVISQMQRSENILLRQTLLNWFSSEIAELSFVSPENVQPEDIEKYDIFLTTEKGNYYDKGIAFYINHFPNHQDYLNLKLAIDGFKSIEDITSIFYKDLFFVRYDTKREDVLCHLTEHATKYFHMEESVLKAAVFQRENMGSTFFGNNIAIPHPIAAVSSDSFVAVVELPQAIEWDKNKNMVNLVLMVCIGKNNAKAFQVWNYLSMVLANKHFTKKLIAVPTYENFIGLLKETIADKFKT